MTNENQKVKMENGSAIEFVGDDKDEIKGFENNVHVLIPDVINSYFDPNHPEFNAHLEYERQEMTNENQKVNFEAAILAKNYTQEELNKMQEQMNSEETKLEIISTQDLIIIKDDLKQLKVLDKPTDTATRLVWIMRTIAYEYSRGKKGCYIPLSEICITNASQINKLINFFENQGYSCKFAPSQELIGDCLEILWG